MRTLISSIGAAAAALTLAATPAHADTDLGPTATATTMTASLILKVRDAGALERFVAATQDPYASQYHRFLSVDEFVRTFAPSDRDIQSITRYLAANGITVTDVYADHLVLKATGTVDAFNSVFATDMHDYQGNDGRRYHRPHHHPSVPTLIADLLTAVAGVDESLSFKSHLVDGHARLPLAPATPPVLPKAGSTASGVPGNYTVGDVANFYNVNPLYAHHIDGRGRTIGIATLSNFVPADAYQYWSLIGLPVKANRITQVHVDGGGKINGGSGETSLDVEQSGGLAPQANIVVYDAPNTDAGFIDLFYKAASDNVVDSLSVSWGGAEVGYFAALNDSDLTGELKAFHQAFLESAAQGISLFAAAGDDGAYDLNGQGLANVLTVDAPGSDPAITAAGGTTVAATIPVDGAASPLVVKQEQVWGWDYLVPYYQAQFGVDVTSDVFSAGGGGGVSVYWPRPWYQDGVHGIRRSEAGQSVIYDAGDGNGPQDLYDLPAHYAGRNVPDVSLNADPFTGYTYYATKDGGLVNGYGGTSFVAPQLNGITALLGQVAGGRLGLLNPLLYRLKSAHTFGPAPLVDVTAGDNWFYSGVPGYEPGAGLGVLDVASLADAIARGR